MKNRNSRNSAPDFHEAEQFEMGDILHKEKTSGKSVAGARAEKPGQLASDADVGNATNPIPQVGSSEEWIARINQKIGRLPEDLITLGQMFLEAKKSLRHGEWEKIF